MGWESVSNAGADSAAALCPPNPNAIIEPVAILGFVCPKIEDFQVVFLDLRGVHHSRVEAELDGDVSTLQ